MFAQCHNVKISGGTFCLYQESDSSRSHSRFPGELPQLYSPLPPPLSQSFHSIRLGDLNLLLEMGKEELVEYHDVRRFKTNALIRRERVVVGVRRIYEASVFGTPGTLTAVIYEGTDFEKWKSEAEKHEAFRHPSLVQLYAVTMSRSMNALIYTERLIPLSEVRELHERSPLASTYVEYGIVSQFPLYVGKHH
ncbi:hypothetical protein B0H13DRAFT_2005344 [Mycena leptocephala]|nr:hypothetical protein B0H13DRAFT_2005344 [Mycena leptocephala]